MGAALATKQQTRVCPSSLNWCKEEKPHQLVACREELPLQSAPITSDFSSIHLFHAAVVHSALPRGLQTFAYACSLCCQQLLLPNLQPYVNVGLKQEIAEIKHPCPGEQFEQF